MTPLQNPYARSAAAWDERIGSARVQATNWRYIAFASITLALISTIGVVVIGIKKQVATYIVEVDKAGMPGRISLASETFQPAAAQVGYFIGEVVRLVRDGNMNSSKSFMAETPRPSTYTKSGLPITANQPDCESESRLFIPTSEVGRRGCETGVAILWRQWSMERRLAARKLFFRGTDPSRIAAAYAAMSDEEFASISARQDWDNWRTIPLAMSGRVPNQPLLVLDLGCGIGLSTEALAFYCPEKSRVIGYDNVSQLLTFACRRTYICRDGSFATVSFVRQSLRQPFRFPDGQQIPDGSVDLVNSSGVLGHHFRGSDMATLSQELSRVLIIGGQAQLDAGPTLPEAELSQHMRTCGFERLAIVRSWLLSTTCLVIFRKTSTRSWQGATRKYRR